MTTKISGSSTQAILSTNNAAAAAPPADVDAGAEPIGSEKVDLGVAWSNPAPKGEHAWSATGGGDSRVVLNAGGVLAQIKNNVAIDANSKQSGDFSEPRTVEGKTLYFTPDGAKAVDTLMQRVTDNNAPLHATKDPGFWERFFTGDPFAGREFFSGKTES